MEQAIAKAAAEFSGPVFIGLGSNLGDREDWLARARAALQTGAGIRLAAQSSLYETAPVGFADQPPFLNQVIELEVALSPRELLQLLLRLERELGRVRRQRWGPRNIDLDVLAFHRLEVQTENLIVPHPEIARRRFVLAPWCEIAPAFVVPRWNLSVQELLARCEDSGRVTKLTKVRG